MKPIRVYKYSTTDRVDGRVVEYWCADGRFRGKGPRKFFAKKSEADAYAKAHEGRGRRARPTDNPDVGVYRARLLDARKGTCAQATLDVLKTQLAHLGAYPWRPGVPLDRAPLTVFEDEPGITLDVVKWYAGKRYAPDSLRLFKDRLRELLDHAVSDGYLSRHPFHDPQTRKAVGGVLKTTREKTPEKVKAMTAAEAQRFLATAAEHSRLYPLFAVGFGCGLRLEELVALTRADDVQRAIAGQRKRQLHVCKALPQRASRRNPVPKRAKTGGDYHVDVPAHVGAILDRHVPTLRPDHPWLFQTSTGSPFSHEAVQGEFKRVLKLAWPKANDNDPAPPQWSITPHGMRHTFATLHILAGKPAAWVSRQLGHRDVVVTLKVYAHAFEMIDATAADEHGARLFGNELATPTPSTDVESAPVLH